MKRLLVTVRALQTEIARFEPEFAAADIRVSCPPVAQAFSDAEMTKLLHDADVAIVGDDAIGRDVLAANRHVRRIVKWGVGMDAIDRAAASELGVHVINTPDALPPIVAEGAIGYLLALTRRLPQMDASVRQGAWLKPRGTSLLGKTAGIVGMGRIGREFATRASAMGMRILGNDVQPSASFTLADGTTVRPRALDEVLAASDVLLLACNYTPDNHHLVNARTIELIKPGAIVVNVARGPLVDTAALIDALQSGRLGGAALDVFEEEPLPAGHPLAKLDNVFLGSHNIQNTDECVAQTNRRAVDLAVEALRDV